jgi:hypothetical protein
MKRLTLSRYNRKRKPPAKKLTDWDGSWHLTGEQLQKKIDAAINQPADVI